jgi:hypothetical protein
MQEIDIARLKISEKINTKKFSKITISSSFSDHGGVAKLSFAGHQWQADGELHGLIE